MTLNKTQIRRRSIFNARRLRRDLTSAEHKLWLALKGRRHDGLKFRRQHPVPPYILDFAERKLKLAIEIDGATHWTDEEQARDLKRTNFLESKGWTVIRFLNGDVYEGLEDVLEMIWLKAIELRDANK
ncbi:endonuclease domain-containing protein [Litorimonas haliclonae]|uniref:endonuclease domain-containing protein n=1 Tax=Litorimonas haliclonae TaxID=2081977 RepID=UPI0039EF6913